MQALDHESYLRLSAKAEVLERDRFGDKVLRLSDGSFLKLFRRKRLISSAALYPYARRFADNARLLNSRNIPCPVVQGVYRVSALARDVVHYAPLPGETLRQLYPTLDARDSASLRAQLGAFIAQLHAQGIYFRSLHLGNVVRTPEQQLGLIDIADLKGQSFPLSQHKRIRNFGHLLRYEADRNWLLADGPDNFFDSYLASAGLTEARKFTLRLKSL